MHETHAIAILPFADMSPQKDQEYFCDGLAEELIAALRNVEGLRVVSRTSSFRFRGSDLGIREIGKKLDVDCIVEGSVRKSGDTLRIVLNLIDVDEDLPLWSERYDRSLVEIFAIQDEISQGIVRKLIATFTPEQVPAAAAETPKAPAPAPAPAVELPQSIQAYEQYLKARFEWNKRTTDSLQRSIGLFKSAITEYPDYALAHAGLADAYVTLAIYGDVAPGEIMPLARLAAETAITLRTDLPEAQTSLACVQAVFDWNWADAIRGFQYAIELDPKYSTARQWLAMHCLAPLGRFAEAREHIECARKNDPDSLVIRMTDGVERYFERDFEKAAEEFRKILETDPGFAMAYYFLGQADLQLNRNDEAIAELEKAVALTGRSAETISVLGYAHSIAGSRIDAVQLAMELTRRSIQDYVSPVLQAQIRIGLGDLDGVFQYLEQAYLARSPELIWIGIRPTMDPVRSDPRFQDLCKRIGLENYG